MSLLILAAMMFSGCAAFSDKSVDTADFEKYDSPAGYISESFLKNKLHILAHDSLKGRGTGQSGSAKAADFIYSFYKSGILSPFEDATLTRQPFAMEGKFWDAASYDLYRMDNGDTIFVSKSRLENNGEAMFYPLLDGTNKVDGEVIFAGYGPAGEEYRKVTTGDRSMEDSWVLLFDPGYDSGREAERVTSDQQNESSISRSDLVRKTSGHYGAAGVIFIDETDSEVWEQEATAMSGQLERPLAVRMKGGRYRTNRYLSGVAVSAHPELAMEMLDLSRKEQLDSLRDHWREPGSTGDPERTGFRFRNKPEINTRGFEEENIIAMIPGSDQRLKEEVIIITAHYDHMGTGEPDDNNDFVYNGADDNASGTVALMNMAKAFARAAEKGYRPSRTLIFLHTAAEEWGLHGARYFIENPLVPGSNIIANVNVDMVGFVDNRYIDQEDQEYIYVIGAGMVSSGLERLVKEANKASINFILDETYNDTNHHLQLYRRSDQWAFGERDIPFVFFFSGEHDHYHQTTDTADRIFYPIYTSRTQMITELVRRIAETPDSPVTDQNGAGPRSIRSR